MFYAALDKPPEEQGTYSVALAVAHEPTGPWYKVGPIVAAGEGSERGANSPSALRSEHPSRVLLIHASLSATSERSTVRELDLSDASKPVLIQEGRLPTAGLATSAGTPDTAPATGRFVRDPFTNRVWRIRASNPLATTPPTNGVSIQLTSIPREKLAAADGEWTVHADFHAPDYGFVRLFTPGFSHNSQGNVCDQRLVELIVSTASAEGADADWLSTYRIHSLRIDHSKTEGDDVGPGSVGDASDEP
jgi:hypothetical protein